MLEKIIPLRYISFRSWTQNCEGHVLERGGVGNEKVKTNKMKEQTEKRNKKRTEKIISRLKISRC
jgi:hypothetical protein